MRRGRADSSKGEVSRLFPVSFLMGLSFGASCWQAPSRPSTGVRCLTHRRRVSGFRALIQEEVNVKFSASTDPVLLHFEGEGSPLV